MPTWQVSKAWADRYWPEIERVVRSVAGDIVEVRQANDEEDQKHATDYVITVASGTIACRVRGWKHWQKWGDVTLRSSRPLGTKTELQKIREGNGRWYLYAWVKPDNTFGSWVFIDLDAVRKTDLLANNHHIENKDRSSTFISLKLPDLDQSSCILSAGGDAIARLAMWRRIDEWRTKRI